MIAIIDYQMGNLRSVQKGFAAVGHDAVITSDPQEIARADHLVLPGVGAFGDAMVELGRRDLIRPLRDAIQAGTPFLGICLGLQLLFEASDEGGRHAGLALLPGHVVRFGQEGARKVPHMGWNRVQFPQIVPVMRDISAGAFFYFVHSYYVVPADGSIVAGETDYGGPFCSMIWRDNMVATQFHPEKSQQDGLRILENFAQWQPASLQ